MAKNIIQEAIVDAKEIKRAAIANAQTIVMEHLKDNVKSFVDARLNEDMEYGEPRDVATEEEEPKMEAMEPVNEMDELELSDVGEEEEADEDGEACDEDGELDEADLRHALELVMKEVEVPGLGEPEMIDPGEGEEGSGVLDVDAKEAGHETKMPPAAEDWTVKEGAYKAKIANLATEVVQLKKALKITKGALDETNLFNRKLYYANKLMGKVSDNNMKREIVKRMDKVKSVAEAKNLYESLDMAIGLMSEAVKPASKAAKKASLAEVLGSSKSDKGVSNLDAASVLREGSSPFSPDRMKRLAGITRDE